MFWKTNNPDLTHSNCSAILLARANFLVRDGKVIHTNIPVRWRKRCSVKALYSDNDLEAIPVLPGDVPVTMPELPIRFTVTTAQQFKAINDPTRSRILGIIQNQPATAKQIADRLGATPGAIGHHLHVLEAAGLAKVVARRLIRGIVANYYTRTARIFKFDLPREVTGDLSASLDIVMRAHDELAEA